MPEVHDMNGGLMPPVKHHHHQNVPHLVAGAQIVELTWEERAREAVRGLRNSSPKSVEGVRVQLPTEGRAHLESSALGFW